MRGPIKGQVEVLFSDRLRHLNERRCGVLTNQSGVIIRRQSKHRRAAAACIPPERIEAVNGDADVGEPSSVS